MDSGFSIRQLSTMTPEDIEAAMRLRVYNVCDSDGKIHRVEAHYIAQPTDNGYTNFITRFTPNQGITSSFYHPRYVKEITILESNEGKDTK